MRNDILKLPSQEKGRDVFFTTMIDLYAFHAELPGLRETDRLRHMPKERVKALEESFGEDIGDDRFIPHIQLHEFETYLFADPECFRLFYHRHEKQIAMLKSISDAYTTPEMINDDPNNAPSKRINNVFPDFEDAESVLGPQIANKIGLEIIMKTCPFLRSGWPASQILRRVKALKKMKAMRVCKMKVDLRPETISHAN